MGFQRSAALALAVSLFAAACTTSDPIETVAGAQPTTTAPTATTVLLDDPTIPPTQAAPVESLPLAKEDHPTTPTTAPNPDDDPLIPGPSVTELQADPMPVQPTTTLPLSAEDEVLASWLPDGAEIDGFSGGPITPYGPGEPPPDSDCPALNAMSSIDQWLRLERVYGMQPARTEDPELTITALLGVADSDLAAQEMISTITALPNCTDKSLDFGEGDTVEAVPVNVPNADAVVAIRLAEDEQPAVTLLIASVDSTIIVVFDGDTPTPNEASADAAIELTNLIAANASG